MRLANEFAAAAMGTSRACSAGDDRAAGGGRVAGLVHGEGTGWKGEVGLALPFSLSGPGPSISTFTATTAPRSSRASRRSSRSGSARTATGPTTPRTLPRRAHPRYEDLLVRAPQVYDNAVAFCRPGASLAELDRRVREGIDAAGYPGQPPPDLPRDRRPRARAAVRAPGGRRRDQRRHGAGDRARDLLGRRRRPAAQDNFLINADGAEKLLPSPTASWRSERRQPRTAVLHLRSLVTGAGREDTSPPTGTAALARLPSEFIVHALYVPGSLLT